MNNYAYIVNECKKAFYGKWDEQAIDACVSRLEILSREELVSLLSCRWLKKNDEVRKEVVKVLFKEQLEQHEQLIATSTIDELGAMLIEKGGNNVKWARIELKRRYQETTHEEQMRIISYFKNDGIINNCLTNKSEKLWKRKKNKRMQALRSLWKRT